MQDTAVSSEVMRAISPHDEMFAGNENHYFGVGQSALDCIRTSLQAAHRSPVDVRRILDLPCGHGRVLRFLKAAFPAAEVTACDLVRDGVNYCAATFGAVPVFSHENPDKIPLERNAFDLIWVGSLFTHFDAGHWGTFLRFFRDCLRPGGVLLFSTHGRRAFQMMAEEKQLYGLPGFHRSLVLTNYVKTGFGYANYPGNDIYGISLSSVAWVFKQLAAVNQLRLVHFSESAWDNHHDVCACVRDPHWQVQIRADHD
jgi:SAM-dependent methyltransferase